jgi:hypothetical protein
VSAGGELARLSGDVAGEATLVDLLDRLLAGGVVVDGHITLAAAGIDLVRLDLKLLLASIEEAVAR